MKSKTSTFFDGCWKMKVLQVCPRFSPFRGGIATHVEELTKNLIALGVDVEVYTTDPEGRLPSKETRNSMKLTRFRSYTLNDLYFFSPGLYLAMKKLENIDIVHVHNYQDFSALAASETKRNYRKPMIFTPHFHPIGASKLRTIGKRIYAALVGERIFQNSDAVIAVSKYEKHLLSESFHLNEESVSYIPNGINVENCGPLARTHKSVEKSILYVGRLEKYKGVQFLIRAFQKVKETEKTSRLLIVGEGSFKKKLIALADDLGLRSHVYFLGNVSNLELSNLYSRSSLFVMPSEYEAFCITLVEAMSYGLPVIATKVGGMSELIGRNSRGLLIDYPPDIEKLAELEMSLLDDSSFSNKIGQTARDYVLARFSWRSVAEKVLKIYSTVV